MSQIVTIHLLYQFVSARWISYTKYLLHFTWVDLQLYSFREIAENKLTCLQPWLCQWTQVLLYVHAWFWGCQCLLLNITPLNWYVSVAFTWNRWRPACLAIHYRTYSQINILVLVFYSSYPLLRLAMKAIKRFILLLDVFNRDLFKLNFCLKMVNFSLKLKNLLTFIKQLFLQFLYLCFIKTALIVLFNLEGFNWVWFVGLIGKQIKFENGQHFLI